MLRSSAKTQFRRCYFGKGEEPHRTSFRISFESPHLEWVSRFGLIFTVLLLWSSPSAFSSPEAWAVPSLKRLQPTTPPGSAREIELFAARGEYESFQIGVHPEDGELTSVDALKPDLAGPNSEMISAANITLYREHFVHIDLPIRGGTNRSLGPGWYPDGLIPFVDPTSGEDLVGAEIDAAPFDVAEGTTEVIWIDVFIPLGTPAGAYDGAFRIVSDQGEASIDLNLTVWDFDLPLTPSLKSSFGIEPDYRAKGKELLRNKLMPRHSEPEDEAEFIENYGLNSTNIGFWSGASNESCWMAPAPSISEIAAVASEHNAGLFLYDYTADEIDHCSNLYPSLKEWGRNLHDAGIEHLVTMTPTPELYDDGSGTGRSAVDVWVLLPKMYDAAVQRVSEVLAKGDEVWSYNCLIQDDYSPKWIIDFTPINYRIQPGFINQSLGLTGLLYWKVDRWSADPWNDVTASGAAYPGEGMLLYPGERVGIDGVCPSMRLKWLRDGVEDYEYIELFKQRGAGDWALGIAAEIGGNWSDWTADAVALETARRELGESVGRIFYDVPEDFWAFDAIAAAFDAGIVEGYGDGGYHPTWNITRGQMAVFIARAILSPTGQELLDGYVPPESSSYIDVPPHYWCYPHVEYLANQEVVSGYPDGCYRPALLVTRDQMAVYVSRAIADPKGEAGLVDYVPPEEPTFADVPLGFWSRKHVEYLSEAGIVQGFPDGRYYPAVRTTRAQMAVYVARAFGLI